MTNVNMDLIMEQTLADLAKKGWRVVYANRHESGRVAHLEKRVRVFPLWLTIPIAILTMGIAWPLFSLFKKTERKVVTVSPDGQVVVR